MIFSGKIASEETLVVNAFVNKRLSRMDVFLLHGTLTVWQENEQRFIRPLVCFINRKMCSRSANTTSYFQVLLDKWSSVNESVRALNADDRFPISTPYVKRILKNRRHKFRQPPSVVRITRRFRINEVLPYNEITTDEDMV